MIDLDDVPGPCVPASRADADKRLLRQVVTSPGARAPGPRRRALTIIALAVVGVTGATAAAAYTVLGPERATTRDSARCYSKVSSDTGDGFPGTTLAVAAAQGQSAGDTPPVALEACANLWRRAFLTPQGFAAPDVKNGPDGQPPEIGPAPPLVACVLHSGQAAVYPGTQAVCEQLGLPLLAED